MEGDLWILATMADPESFKKQFLDPVGGIGTEIVVATLQLGELYKNFPGTGDDQETCDETPAP